MTAFGGSVGRNRSAVLELAVLGLLHTAPMHGYELRKRLNTVLGAFRAFSYGSLYPCLGQLLADGLIAEEHEESGEDGTGQAGADDVFSPAGSARPDLPGRPLRGGAARSRAGRRSRKVYRLTADGKERLQELLREGGPAAWEDDGFGVHFAFFGQTRADVRLRILEGRRSRLEERMEAIRAAFTRTRERVDSYTLELHRHGLESVEREVRWLNELIASERQADRQPQAGGQGNISEKESS
jgi:DNA-binding PadR family transcriptional regulator